MLMLHCHSALLSRYVKKHEVCLNIFIHELISRLASEPNFREHNSLRIQIQKDENIFEIFYILNKVGISDMQFQYFIWALVS